MRKRHFFPTPLAKLAIFTIGSIFLAVLGYVPWNYAKIYETFRVDFRPFFASEVCSLAGILCKSFSLILWVSGVSLLIYLLYKQELMSLWKLGQKHGWNQS